MTPERFVVTVRVVFILILLLLAYLVWGGHTSTPSATSERVDPSDPVALFHTTGIQECGYDVVHKFEGARAVRLDQEDTAVAREFLLERFQIDASMILYTNSPVATKDMPGQPALIPLKQVGDAYCALGVVGSSSVSLFLALQEKYQTRIE